MVEAAGRGDHLGIWFNSRPKTNLHVEKRFLRHIEIEALPTGGWGYAYFPYVARFVRPLGLPTLSHTGRFFKSWGDNAGLKPHAALKYECCQILSQGMALGVGDLLHPRGAPDPAVYDLIGSVYRYIERCQEVAAGGRLQSEIAVVVDPELGDRPGPAGLGTTRALQQLRLQFDILPPAARLDGYPVVVVLSNTPVDDAFRAALRDYVAGGGSLMLWRNGGARPGGDAVARRAGDRGVRAESVRQHLPEAGARGVRRIGRFRPCLVRIRLPHGAGRWRAVAGPRRGAVLRAVTRPVLRALVHPARPAVALLRDRAQPSGGWRSGDHQLGPTVRRLRGGTPSPSTGG